MNDIVSKFTNHLKNALTRALCLAVETKGDAITPTHLLWALGTQQGCVASEILLKAGIDTEELRAFAGDKGSIPDQPLSHEQNFVPVLSEEAKNVIEKAVLTANVYEHRYIGTEHLLAGLLQTSPKELRDFFRDTKTDIRVIQVNLAAVFKTTAAFPEFPDSQKTVSDALQELESFALDSQDEDEEDESKTPAIDYFTEEMTLPEVVEDITPVVGREPEIRRLAKILSRKQKNNPILVGKPGVGKTAIVEGLAKKIVEGDVPPALQDRKIFQLDLAAMIAGTMYRGEFESRLRQLIDEVTDRPEVILFIDEVHTIMGAGAASGSLDAANILKPALARGDIRCIGATTPEEYKKHIEPDGALERRFQQITVKEPTKKETGKILSGVKKYYEEHHRVTYTKAALREALELADRYFPGKSFPDKAIDILDEAGASANLGRVVKKSSVPSLKSELEDVQDQKRKAVTEERFREAIDLKKIEEKLELELDKEKKKSAKLPKVEVDADVISTTVAEMCGIPLKQLSTSEHKRLSTLSDTLKQEVIGQNKAVEQVANAVRRAKLGFARKHQPLASFLFLGPSGVGKTHLAKVLAEKVFNDSGSFLRLDMSEYAEAYTVSKLIGSPAGYVGYRETTKLTDHVKQHPHSVVLFDELEKAHPDVHNLLLQVLDDGMLTDATGRKINFRNTVIIMTTNAGRELFEGSPLGFGDQPESVKKQQSNIRELLENQFKPELLNRIHHVCLFERLTEASLEKITKKELSELKERLGEQGIHCRVTASVSKLVTKSVRAKFGARDIQRVIEEVIEHKIANELLKSSDWKDAIRVSAKKNGQIEVKPFEKSA